MIRRMDRLAVTLMLSAALLLGWSAVAQAQYYTVHQTSLRARIAYEDCEGDCQLRYERLNNQKFIRLMCGIPDEERIPRGFVVATYIDCQEAPDAMIGVWDKGNDSHVCGSLGMGVISAAHQETGPNSGKAEFLYGAEGPPLLASARARYGPLARKFEMEETSCWLNFRTRSLTGALDEDVVILDGEARAGAPIALYD